MKTPERKLDESLVYGFRQNSYIEDHGAGGGMTFVGPDATEFFRAAALKSMIHGMRAGLTFRVANQTQALRMAGKYTGQKYKRSKLELIRAEQDLQVWIDNMRLALPRINSGERK